MRLLPVFAILIVLILSALVLASAPGDMNQASTITDYTVSGSETWDDSQNPYIIEGHLIIAATGQLTITAGVEVQIMAGRQLLVKNGGHLTIQGSAAEPVQITSITDYFAGLIFEETASVQLTYSDISQAGAAGAAALTINGSDVFVDHCFLHENGDGSARAVYLVGGGISPSITNSSIENNSGQAIYQHQLNMNPTYQNLTLSGNDTNAVVIKGGSLSADLTLDGRELNGSPFLISDGWIGIIAGATVTVTPGTKIQFAESDTGISVSSGSTLLAEGTEAMPILFRPDSPADIFRGLVFNNGAYASLAYCDMSGAGGVALGPLHIDASDVTIDHCTIHDNAANSPYAIYLGYNAARPTIKNTTVSNNPGEAIHQERLNLNPIFQNLTLIGNDADAVVIEGGSLSQDLTLDGRQLNGSPYLMAGQSSWIGVTGGATLTITQGTEIQFVNDDAGISVSHGSALLAEGTEAEPILFRPDKPAEQFRGLLFESGSQVSLSHCDVSRAGGTGLAPVHLYSSDAVIDNCIIHESAPGTPQVIDLAWAGLSPTIKNTTIENNPGRAIYQHNVNMNPIYQNVTMSGNDIDAVVIRGGNQSQDVTLDGRGLNGSAFIVVGGWIGVNGGDTLTIEPGTELLFDDPEHGLAVGFGGTLLAAGTPTQTITIAATESAQYFRGVLLEASSLATLSHCDIHHAGDIESAALRVYAINATISHCIIHDNQRLAMRLFSGSGSIALDNMVLNQNGEGGLRVDANTEARIRHATIAHNSGNGLTVINGGSTIVSNTILANNATAVSVQGGGNATLDHTLWDGNIVNIDGTINETNRVEGSVLFDADGYHLTEGTAALEAGASTGLVDDIDGQVRPEPAGSAPDIGADEFSAAPHQWYKWIDDRLWGTGFSLTVQTADQVEVIDTITTEPKTPYYLVDKWDPAHLNLVGYDIQPMGAGIIISHTGVLTWMIGVDHPQSITMTKLFHIQPCTWTQTTLVGRVSGLDVIEPSRSVVTNKAAPELWLNAQANPVVHAGQIATFTLMYGNDGGYETNMVILATLAEQTTLFDSQPPPSEQAEDGTILEWWIPELGQGDSGRIEVALTIPYDAGPGSTTIISVTLANHAGQVITGAEMTYAVIERPLHDAAITGVIPGGELPLNEAVDIVAELANLGHQPESNVPLNCNVKSAGGDVIYAQGTSSGPLEPGLTAMVPLLPWTPTAAGAYTLTCHCTLPGDEKPANDHYSQQLTVNSEGVADIWTKDNQADNGTLPSSIKWWLSPDIWVRHQADGGLAHQNPLVDQENTIYIRIRNSGQQAASGHVDIFWSRSRIGWACKLLAPNVGSISFEELAPDQVRIISLAWVPREPGHHGLNTIIETEGDPADKSLPCSPHRPRWDNNASWRNVIAYRHPIGHTRKATGVIEAIVDLVNIYDRPKDIDLIFDLHSFPVTGTVTLRLAEELFDRWLTSPGSWSTNAMVITDTRQIVVTGVVSAAIGGLPLDAYDQSAGDLSFFVPQSGEFEVTLEEFIDGLAIGGVTYLWTATDLLPPQVTSHRPLDEAVDVDLDTPLVVEFSEEIGPLTLNLALTPEVGVWGFIFSEAGTTVTATHASMSPNTRYTATVTAADAFANPMLAPYSWSFTTRLAWFVYLPMLTRH